MALTIGVAICAYKGHIPHLQRLFASIAGQTRLPDQVVVRCSSTKVDEFPYRPDMFTFPVRFLLCEEYQNAAQNRNVAMRQLHTDIVSFMDADDVMHPQRLEIIYEAFSRYPGCKLLLHDTTDDPSYEHKMYPESEWKFYPNRLYRCIWGSTQLYPPIPGAITTNGHASVAREVLVNIRFRETAEYYGREDTLFSTDVIQAYPRQTIYCHMILSHYYPSHTRGYRPI